MCGTFHCKILKGLRALEISVSALFPQAELQNAATAHGDGTGGDVVDILLVEDNDDDVELTLHAFKKARFTNRVHVVNDGAEALDFIFCRGKYARRNTEERPQLILLDLQLPKVSGLEVLRRIKADKLICGIPVVILTISDDTYDIAECRRLGAENYIIKPVDFQRLSGATPLLNLNWVLTRPLSPNGRDVRR